MSCEHEVRFTIKPTDDACRFHFDVRAYKDRIVAPDEYSGVTEVTPSHIEQVLPTTDKLVRDDITIFPAPTETLSTTSNGTFTPSSGKVGFSAVTVDVNPDLRPLSVSENGTYEPEGFDGYSSVTVNNPAQWTTEGIADGSEPNGDIDLGDATIAADYAFYKCSGITSVTGKNVTKLGVEPFSYCDNLEKLSLPNATSMTNGFASPFRSCFKLKEIHLPRIQFPTTDSVFSGLTIEFIFLPSTKAFTPRTFQNCANLKTVIAPSLNDIASLGGYVFNNCTNLKTLVLGNSSVVATRSTNHFDGTPFAEGGSGGDIYIPKALYDHLGDGSNLDYLSNPRWNTFNGYGTITWHPIEGSEYETYMPGGAKYEEEMALT